MRWEFLIGIQGTRWELGQLKALHICTMMMCPQFCTWMSNAIAYSGCKFWPYLADFGLAKLMIAFDFHLAISRVADSLGCIATQWTLQRRVMYTEASSGIVLLEILTGRSTAESRFGDGLCIVYWVKQIMWSCKPLLYILDSRLRGMPHPWISQTLWIAIFCV